MNEWISWFDHPVPEDVKGILIKYDDGVFSDRYNFETKKRKYREGHMILGWKFMERSDPNKKSIQCNQPERLNPEARQGCDSLNSQEIVRGKSEEVSPPCKSGQ